MLLTIVIGVGAGFLMTSAWRGYLLFGGHSFGCTLAMGVLARRRQVAIALASCATISITIAWVAAVRQLESERTLDVSGTLALQFALFIIAAVFAALALPFAKARLR
jgi:hypothetical protein